MFTASADLYDLIYTSLKDYQAGASQVAALVRDAHPAARRVLDVACGTAEHARLLVEEHGFEVDGLDLDPAFVRIAREKVPSATIHEADMTSFALPGRYDAILCLFSSIGYVLTLENVRRTLERFRAHLAEGGVVLVEPWFTPGVLQPGDPRVEVVEGDGVRVCRMSHIVIEERVSHLRFEYLIGRAAGIEHAVESHDLGLFTVEEMLGCFRDARLDATYDPQGPSGRGLYLARALEPEVG